MGLFEETVYWRPQRQAHQQQFRRLPGSGESRIFRRLIVIFLDYPDKVMSEYGARGVGEIGLTGCASALTMATYHATGVRSTGLPIRIEKLMV